MKHLRDFTEEKLKDLLDQVTKENKSSSFFNEAIKYAKEYSESLPDRIQKYPPTNDANSLQDFWSDRAKVCDYVVNENCATLTFEQQIATAIYFSVLPGFASIVLKFFDENNTEFFSRINAIANVVSSYVDLIIIFTNQHLINDYYQEKGEKQQNMQSE